MLVDSRFRRAGDVDPEAIASLIERLIAGEFEGADVSMDVEVFRDVDWQDHDEDDHRDHDDHDDHEHHHDWDGHREIDDVEDVFEMVGEMVEGFMHEAMGELQQRFHDFEQAQSWAEGMDERSPHR